jgi:hypothetical protein
MMFRVGQKVVCINARGCKRGEFVTYPDGYKARSSGDMGGLTNGVVYTVETVGFVHGAETVKLVEINREDPRGRGEPDPGFHTSRFRPVVDLKTDISCFTRLLNPTATQKVLPEIGDAMREAKRE